MKILEIQHIRGDSVLYEGKNLYNTLHIQGEQLLLQILFSGQSLPASYYVGLDNRTTITASDTLSSLVGESTGGGYVRQALLPGSFAVTFGQISYQATSPVVTFASTGVQWGPVSNIFLASSVDNSGVLIASAPLNQSITVSPGESVLMRMALSLQDAG